MITEQLEFIYRIAPRLNLFKQIRKDLWDARCPVCGDSEKKWFKKRFYIYQKGDGYSVKCHNCGYSAKFPTFLKKFAPDEYKQYLIATIGSSSPSTSSRFSTTKHVKEILPEKCKGFDYSPLIQFTNLPEDHPARQYVTTRKIPFDRVLYCPVFSSFIKHLGINKYTISYENSHEPRLIIPFFRTDGLSTVFQARAFSPKEKLRYITIKEQDTESKIYGLDRIDRTKTVFCVEGPIDAMMIPNTIAMSGASVSVPFSVTYVYDNEPRNIDIVNNMRKRLIFGDSVVIYPDSIQYKDLNDMVVKGKMNTTQIINIISDNVYSGGQGIMKLKQWSKV